MNIKNQKDLFFGLIFMSIGVTFAWGATTYKIGSAARNMGPGYFPLMLGVLLALIGLVITMKALLVTAKDDSKIGKWAWKPLFFIIAANVIFGISLGGLPSIKLPAFGMIAGIYALTFLASMAKGGWSAKVTFILATILAFCSYLTFVVALKLRFPVWPAFIIN